MGEYLSTPNKEKKSTDDMNQSVSTSIYILKLKYGACGMQGWRKSMEDAHVT